MVSVHDATRSVPDGAVETYPRHGLWHNHLHAADGGFLGTHASRDEAVEAGRQEARWRGVPHVVREADGSATTSRDDLADA